MTKEQFLQDFKDINYMYNNSMMLDSLENHINDLLETELEKIKAEIDTMLKSDEVKNDKWANVIINKSYLFKRIINNHIKELKGENNG